MANLEEIKEGLSCGNYRCDCHRDHKKNVHCPAHDDRHPSLSIGAPEKDVVLWYCHAGCSQKDVEAALKERGLLGKMIRTRKEEHYARGG